MRKKKMSKLTQVIILILAFAFTMKGALAAAPSFDLGDCYDPVTIAASDGYVPDLVIEENCSNYGRIDWTGTDLNLTLLGQVLASEVKIGRGWAYVNSIGRPDLDEQAIITLKNLTYAYQPTLKKDGVDCSSNCTSVTYTRNIGQLRFTVSGFSNYSVTGRQDFSVYSDTEAYLHGRVYDAVDLGSVYLNQEFKCIVMIFDTNEKRLIQTNPEKKKAGGGLFGSSSSSDENLPEILGYFKIENSVGNVYYRDADLVGYNTFIKVIKCNSNSTELIYEELITPQYKEAFGSAPSRGVWVVQNASMLAIIIIGGIFATAILYFTLKKLFT
jgi:hypothetical protein